MVYVDNTCINETAVKDDVVNITYNFTQNVNVSDLHILKKYPPRYIILHFVL